MYVWLWHGRHSRSSRGANFLKQATARSITPWLSPIVQNFPVSPEMAASKLWSNPGFTSYHSMARLLRVEQSSLKHELLDLFSGQDASSSESHD